MKPINVSGTYSFDEVLAIVNEAMLRAGENEFDILNVGDLIDIVNHLAAREETKAAKPAKKRGRPKGSTNKSKTDAKDDAKPEGEKEEKKASNLTAESGTTAPVGASAVANGEGEDDFDGLM